MKNFEMPDIAEECLGVKSLVDVPDKVNHEVQQSVLESPTLDSASACAYKLGPCFRNPPSTPARLKPTVIDRLLEFYPSNKSDTLVRNFSRLVSKDRLKLRHWHKPNKAYCNWVKSLEKRLGEKWRDLRIYETIILSTRLISFDDSLLTALVCFWDSSCNAFLLPEGPIGITMEDVVAITCCSPTGIELSTLETIPPIAKNAYKWCEVKSYGSFLEKAEKLKNPDQEEVAFYLYWVSKFLTCNRSGYILRGYQPVAETIFHAKGPIALAPFLLGFAYNCLGNIIRTNFSCYTSGPLWLVLLWAQAYFSPIAARNTHVDLPNQRDQKKLYSYGDQIIFSQVECKKTFEECFSYLIDRAWERQGEEWNPFLKRQYGPNWLREFSLHKGNNGVADDAWKAILIARDLPVYCTSSSVFLEPYSPNQFARQLGHLQSLPVPFYKTINQPWQSRNEVSVSVLKQSEQKYMTRKSAISEVRRIRWSPSKDAAFDTWWSGYWSKIVPSLSQAQELLVSRFREHHGRFLGKRARVPSQLSRSPSQRHKRIKRYVNLKEYKSIEEEEEPEEEDPEEEDPEEDELEEEGEVEEVEKLVAAEEEEVVILTKWQPHKSTACNARSEEEDEAFTLADGQPHESFACETGAISGEDPSLETFLNTPDIQDSINEKGKTAAVRIDEGISSLKTATGQQNYNLEQHRMNLERYLGMPIETICKNNDLSNMVRSVDALLSHSGDEFNTFILEDLRKELTDLQHRNESVTSVINCAQAELEFLPREETDLSEIIDRQKLALQAEERKFSDLTKEETRLEMEIHDLQVKKESVQSQKASSAKSIEKRKQKMMELKKAEYTCSKRRNEFSKLNANLMEAKRMLFK